MRLGLENFQGELVILMIFIRPAQNGDRLDSLTEVSRLLKSLILILPSGQLLILDQALHLFDGNEVLLNSWRLDIVINEVKLIYLIFELLQPKDDGSDENGSS